MSGVITVFKRELKSYFATPVAYVHDGHLFLLDSDACSKKVDADEQRSRAHFLSSASLLSHSLYACRTLAIFGSAHARTYPWFGLFFTKSWW